MSMDEEGRRNAMRMRGVDWKFDAAKMRHARDLQVPSDSQFLSRLETKQQQLLSSRRNTALRGLPQLRKGGGTRACVGAQTPLSRGGRVPLVSSSAVLTRAAKVRRGDMAPDVTGIEHSSNRNLHKRCVS